MFPEIQPVKAKWGWKIAAATAALLFGVVAAPQARAEQWTGSCSVSGRPDVRIKTDDGGVTVTPGSGGQVQYRVDYTGYTVDKNLHIEARQNGNTCELAVRTGHWGINISSGWHKNLHLTVSMPQDADLDVNTGDGGVEVQRVKGKVSIQTGDGGVRASDLNGDIYLHSGDGSITAESLAGNIRIHTGDGHIEGRGLDGTVDADSGDGHITLEGRFDGLNIKTGDGSVSAKAGTGSKMGGSWNIRTGDGSVDLTLPGDLQANIDASTSDGRISLGLPVTVEGTFSNSQIHGKMNGGGPALTVHTGDGSIRLSKT